MKPISRWTRERPAKEGWFFYRDAKRSMMLTHIKYHHADGNLMATRLDLVSRLDGEWLEMPWPAKENEPDFDPNTSAEYVQGRDAADRAYLIMVADLLQVKVSNWDGIRQAIEKMRGQIVDLQQLVLKTPKGGKR